MTRKILLTLMASTLALGLLTIGISRAEENDGASNCLSGPTGSVVAGSNGEADGMVYDATKAAKSSGSKTDCTQTSANGETEDEDGDSD
jgi:hypothetical protein